MNRKVQIGLYAGAILLFAALVGYISISYGSFLTALLRNREALGGFLSSFGMQSFVVFIFLQAAQIVLTPIPGEFVQLAAGYLFGTWLGTAYAVAGALLGTLLSFSIARWLGYPLVKLIFGEKKLAAMEALINKPQSRLILFLLFLIPGLPKDVLTYAAGATPIDPLQFVMTATTARIPGIILSAYIGANLYQQDYTAVSVACLVTVLLFGLGIWFQGRLNRAPA